MTRKCAIVTGAAQGIGRSIALGLAEAGLNVVAADRNVVALEGFAQSLTGSALSGRVLTCTTDVTDAHQVDHLVEVAVGTFGPPEVLVNNAGQTQSSLIRVEGEPAPLFTEISEVTYRNFLDLHVIAPFLLVRAALPYMRLKGWGRVVTITTSLSTMLKSRQIPYGSSKASGEAQMAVMASDLKGAGIGVNVLVPGAGVDTPGAKRPAARRSTMLSPEVMVPPVVWLTSEASDGVTGMRFVAAKWSVDASIEENIAQAGAPIGWPGLQAVDPSTL